jgi:hypothetical protein
MQYKVLKFEKKFALTRERSNLTLIINHLTNCKYRNTSAECEGENGYQLIKAVDTPYKILTFSFGNNSKENY